MGKNKQFPIPLEFTMVVKHFVRKEDTEDTEDTLKLHIRENLSPSDDSFWVKTGAGGNDFNTNEPWKEVGYEDVRLFCEQIINDGDLADKIKEKTGYSIHEVKVSETREGCLEIILLVFAVIGGVVAIHDAYEKIKKIIEDHMTDRLRKKFYTHGSFDVTVCFNEKQFASNHVDVPDTRPKRDAFFWYLLVSNIILLGIIGLLVGKAVASMYW